MIQTTLVQLDNYGPWTVTPEPRAEMCLQALQARLYADLAEAVGHRNGYAFYTRGDNMISVTNGIGREAHAEIQSSLAVQYPVTTSMAIGTGATPKEAVDDASALMQSAGGAQSPNREMVVAGTSAPPSTDQHLSVAHFDVIDVTGRYTDRMGAFETYRTIERGYSSLMDHLYTAHGALSFFVGGDNVVALCPSLPQVAYREALEHVREATGVTLQVGVGTGATATEAGMAAKHGLERCRKETVRITMARD
ncbi:GTP cyclohydrolase IIa [Halomarina rubra]|uniref:GTP cyclohydrolase III n=1 Tax=Halomarina rubra TaxID=2071873 RepID=A0ABD6AX14_9EURY